MKKSYCLILSLSLLLVGCNDVSSTSKPSSESTSSSTSNSTSNITSSVAQSYTKSQTYQHSFVSGDIKAAGGQLNSINGLTWTTTATTYLGYTTGKGVQLGSANNPQTTPWTISTSFGEDIQIDSYEICLSNAKGGSANYIVSGSNGQINTEDFSTTTSSAFTYSTAFTTSSFELSLKASAKGMYLNSIKLTVKTTESSSLSLSEDEIEEEGDITEVIPGTGLIPKVNFQSLTDTSSYYTDVDLTASGNTLRTNIHNKISTMTNVNYGQARYMLQYSDENPTKKGYLYGLYDGDDIKAKWDEGISWNREHVWACAQMKIGGVDPRPGNDDIGIGTDLFNLRVACPQANGYHSDKFYDLTNTSNTMLPNLTSSEISSGTHNFTGDHRGDVARTLFYMYSNYIDLQLDNELNTNNDISMGKLSVLLQWNKEDPVDEFEKQRNNRIYNYQGNRNPFVDYYDSEGSLANRLFA